MCPVVIFKVTNRFMTVLHSRLQDYNEKHNLKHMVYQLLNMAIQWNLSIPDTLGTNIHVSVLISGVNLYYKGTFVSDLNTGVSSFQGVLNRVVSLYN